VDIGHDEVLLSHLFRQFLTFVLGIHINKALVHVNIPKNLYKIGELVHLIQTTDVVLLNTLQGQVFLLYQDLGWVTHDVLGQSDNILTHGSGEKTNLAVGGDKLNDFIDLLQETKSEHLIGFIDDKHLQMACFEISFIHHIKHSSRSSDYNMASFL
jgi:hypothetical protein